MGTESRADETTENRATHRALITLDARERRIILLRYWCDLDRAEIAKKLGLSMVRVSQIENGALRKMRWSMTGFDADELKPKECCAA